MLDINYIREHEQVVRQAMLDKQLETQSLDELLSIDTWARKEAARRLALSPKAIVQK